MEQTVNREKFQRDIAQDSGDDAEIAGLINEANAALPSEPPPTIPLDQQGDEAYASYKKRGDDLGKTFDGIEKPEPQKDTEGKPFFAENFFGLEELKGASKAAGAGVVKSFEDLGNGGITLANAAEDFFASKGLGDGKWLEESTRINIIDVPDNPADMLVFSAARYLLPFSALGRGLKALGLAGKTLTATQVGGAGALTVLSTDPDQKGLLDMVNAVPYVGLAIPDILTSQEDDTRLERRLKRGAESVGFDLLTLGMVKGIAAVKRAKDAMKAAQKTEAAIQKVAPTVKTADDAKAAVNSLPKEKPEIPLDAKGNPVDGVTEEAVTAFDENLKSGMRNDLSQISEVEMRAALNSDESLVARLKEQVGEKESYDALLSRAAKQYDTPEKIQEVMDKAQPGVVLNKEEIAVVGMETARRNKTLGDFHARIGDREKTAVEMAEELLLTERAIEGYIKTTGGTSHYGYLLNMAKMAIGEKSMARKQEFLREFKQIMGDEFKETSLYFRAAQAAEVALPDISKNLATNRRTHRIADGLYLMTINGMLAGLDTLRASTISPMILTAGHVFGMTTEALKKSSPITMREVGAFIGTPHISGKVSGSIKSLAGAASAIKNQKGWTAVKAELAEGATYWQDVMEAFTAGKRGILELKPPEGWEDIYQFRGNSLQTERKDLYGKLTNVLSGIFITPATRLLQGFDNVNKIMGSRAYQRQLAMRTALVASNNPDEIMAVYNATVKNPPKQFQEAGQRFANRNLLQAKAEDLIGGERLEKIGEGMGVLFPFGGKRYSILFSRMLNNTFDYPLRHSPLAYLADKTRGQLSAHKNALMKQAEDATKITPKEIKAAAFETAEAKARVTTGTAILGIGTFLGMAGLARGKLKRDYRTERATATPGAPIEDSFVFGGKWHSFKKADPAATLMGFGADLGILATYMFDSEDERKFTNAGSDLVQMFAERIPPRMLTESVYDILQAFQDFSNPTDRKIDPWADLSEGVAQKVAAAAPGRWMAKNVVSKFTGDNVKRELGPDKDLEGLVGNVTEFGQMILNNLKADWGITGDLPKQRNIFYQEIQVPPGFSWVTNMPVGAVSAFFTDEQDESKVDPVILELRRLGMDNANLGHLRTEEMEFSVRMPMRTTYKGSKGKNIPYKMTLEEYDKLLKFMQGPIPVGQYGGRNLYGVIKYLTLEATEFSDEKKKLLIKKAFADHLKHAKGRLKFEEPHIEEEYKKIDYKRGRRLMGVEP